MYLDYSKLEASQIKQPALRLQTLAGKELGVIRWENQSGLSFADQLQNAVYRTAWYLHSSEAGYIR